MKFKRLGVRLAVAVVAMSAAATMPALASLEEQRFAVEGTVSNVAGAVLGDVSVNGANSTAPTRTADDGTYRLEGSSYGEIRGGVCAGGDDWELVCHQFDAGDAVDGVVTVDFSLRHSLFAMAAGTGADGFLPVRMLSGAADPGVAGEAGRSCVTLASALDGQTYDATYAGRDDTISRWTGRLWELDLPIPADSGHGWTTLGAVRAVDCATGAEISETYTVSAMVDRAGPTVVWTFPTGFVRADDAAIVVDAYDEQHAQGHIAPSRSALFLDGVALDLSGSTTNSLLADAGPLESGTYRVTGWVADGWGNRTALDWTFDVDIDGPELSAVTPTGTISDATPTISVALSDAGAGVNPSRIRFAFVGGPARTGTVGTHRATYDASTGVASYEVPLVPTGLGWGQKPLADGRYAVEASAYDSVGNRSTARWTFTVDTLAGVTALVPGA